MQKPRSKFTPHEVAAVCLATAVIFAVLFSPLVKAYAAAHLRGFAPNDACVGNTRMLGTAVLQYAQDSDELLPTMNTPSEFQAVVLPYAKDPALFYCPDTGLPYTPNATLSHQSIGQYPSVENVEVLRDTEAHADGLLTVAFLDGHVERGSVEQGDPSQICLAHARTVALGIIQFVQDNTPEVYPPMNAETDFEAALFPYTHSHRAFINPIDGKPFVLNSALSGVPASSVTDRAHTVLLQSAGLLPNGYPVIAYADGHVTNGPVLSSAQGDGIQDRQNLQRIGLGVSSYAQDNNGYLPTTTDYAMFQAAVQPYTGSDPSIFLSPGSGLQYVLNPAVSGLSLWNIPDPATTELMRDARRNADGTLYTLFLSGSVQKDVVNVPLVLSLGPDDTSLLLWRSADGSTPLWTLAADGSTLTTQTDTTDLVGIGSANVGLDNKTHLALGFTTRSALETLTATGTVETRHDYGIYDGWRSFAAGGIDGTLHRVFLRYDSTVALWNLSPDGQYLSDSRLIAPSKKTFVGAAVGGDGITRILWQDARRNVTLWEISAAGRLTSAVFLAAPTGQIATGIAVGPDNRKYLLWSGTSGRGQIWTITGRTITRRLPLSLPGAGQASSLVVGAGSDRRVLWRGTDLTGRLQILSAAGAGISVRVFPAYH